MRFRFRPPFRLGFHSRRYKMRAVRLTGSGCLTTLALVPLLIAGSFYAIARAATYQPSNVCPGRVEIIELVEHPSGFVRDRLQRGAWAAGTQSEIDACAEAGIISNAYAFYMGLEIDARIVRYMRSTSTDPAETRRALAAFDRLFIDSRPTLLGTTFANYENELRDHLHRDTSP